MDKFFKIMGMIFTGLLVIALLFIGGAYAKSAMSDRSSKAFVDDAFPKIATDWSPDTFSAYADKERMGIDDAKLKKLFSIVQTHLGKLKTYNSAVGQSSTNYQFNGTVITTAKFAANIECDKDTAKLEATLLKEDAGWKIVGFNIDSAALRDVGNAPAPDAAPAKAKNK